MVFKPFELTTSRLEEIERDPKIPVCPLCVTELEGAKKDYKYKKMNPDTRWFWCNKCEAHYGYHRIKGKWRIDPYEFDPVLLEGNGRISK